MTGYDETAIGLIRKWDKAREREIRVDVYLPGTPEDNHFKYLVDHLGALSRQLKLVPVLQAPSEKLIKERPAVFLDRRIMYSALPYDRELPPFLDALAWTSIPPVLSPGVQKDLDQVSMDVFLKLYIAQACPHCPDVVRTVVGLAVNCRRIFLEIVDGTLFGEAAQADGVMSAPCLILDSDFRWTGPVTAEEICEMILYRDPSRLGTESLRTILEEGRAAWIAEKMILQDNIFEGFMGLLLHTVWSVRLGAMVVVEELVEKNPRLALNLCPELLESFDGKDIATQGDILYALGAAGDLNIREKIRDLLPVLTDGELIEAAQEAMAAIESRY